MFKVEFMFEGLFELAYNGKLYEQLGKYYLSPIPRLERLPY